MSQGAGGRTVIAASVSVRGRSPGKALSLAGRGLQLQSNFLSSSKGPRQGAGLAELDKGLTQGTSPERKQPEQPQRWETSTKLIKAVR